MSILITDWEHLASIQHDRKNESWIMCQHSMSIDLDCIAESKQKIKRKLKLKQKQNYKSRHYK